VFLPSGHVTDYLQPVGKAGRIVSIVGCMITAIVCQLVSIVVATDMIQRGSINYQGKPLWMSVLVLGLLGGAAAFIAWRLVRRHASANGITILPVRFIQLSGILLLTGLCFVAWYRGSVIFMFEAVPIFVAMIFVGTHIAKKQRQRDRRPG
jgi:hypothetical protein